MTTDIEELERKYEAATPGPYTVDLREGTVRSPDDTIVVDYSTGEVASHDLEAIAATHNALPGLIAELRAAREALTKISAIRDSIVGLQGFNFSEHAYPLVAALKAAGYEGAGYAIASANLGTLLQRIATLEAERDALREVADAYRLLLEGRMFDTTFWEASDHEENLERHKLLDAALAKVRR